MDDRQVGFVFRAVRRKRGLRQADVAEAVGVHRSMVSRIERGRLGDHNLDALRRVAGILAIQLVIEPRWRGADLPRLLNARHSELHEQLAAWFSERPGWVVAPEVSFSIYGERGVIDVLAWHERRRAVLVIELKTALVDVNELLGTVDRKRRLAGRIARERGWDPIAVGCWVVVAEGGTNRRHVAAHANVLRAALPTDGRGIRHWLADPSGAVAGLSFWSGAHAAHARSTLPPPHASGRAGPRSSERNRAGTRTLAARIPGPTGPAGTI